MWECILATNVSFTRKDVHVSSFDSADELFDEYNLGRLLFATRVLPYINKEASLNTTETNPYYK